jgi:hypothetical protein
MESSLLPFPVVYASKTPTALMKSKKTDDSIRDAKKKDCF